MIKLLCIDHVTKILGGGEINLLELLERIDRGQFEPLVACVAGGTLDRELDSRSLPRAYFELSKVISEFRLVNRRLAPLRALRSISALKNAAHQVSKIAFEAGSQVLLSSTNKDHFAAGLAGRRLGRPSIWWVNDILCRDFFSPMTLRAFSLMARRYADRLVTVSDHGKEALINLGITAEKITTIHNGIAPERYRRQDGRALRSMLGVPEGSRVVTILGRVTPWKGHKIFVEMASRIAGERPDIHFWIAGGVFNEDEQYAEQLRNQAAQAGLGDRLRFLQFHKDVVEVYSASDIVVHCSLKPEPFGRVLIEAMACEVPVVAAGNGGVKEIVEHNSNGLLVPVGDVSSYAEAVCTLLSNPDKALSLGRRGRATVVERFSLDRMVGRFEDLITRVAGKENHKGTKTERF